MDERATMDLIVVLERVEPALRELRRVYGSIPMTRCQYDDLDMQVGNISANVRHVHQVLVGR